MTDDIRHPGRTSFFQRTDWLSFGITTVLTWSIYLWFMAPEVTLERSGIYSTGAEYAGVSPPPGYPLWTILGWLFTVLLPFGNIAWRLGVLSTLAGAFTCGLIALMVSQGGGRLLASLPRFARLNPNEEKRLRRVCGFAAGMIFGFNGAFWEMAEIVDVWPLSILLLTVMVCLLMRWVDEPERRRPLYAACFIYGLTITNSQALLVAAPAILLIAVTVKSNDKLKALTVGLVLFVLGLTPYLYLPLASMTTPPSNWGYARTVEGFFHVLSRGQYDRIHPTDNWIAYLQQLWLYAKVTGNEFGWIYFPFALFPLCFIRQMPGTERRRSLALLALFAGLGPFMVALLNPELNRPSAELNMIFFSASYVILAMEVGRGMVLAGALMTRPSQLVAAIGTPSTASIST